MAGGLGAVAEWWPIKVGAHAYAKTLPVTVVFILDDMLSAINRTAANITAVMQAYRPCPALTDAGMNYTRCLVQLTLTFVMLTDRSTTVH